MKRIRNLLPYAPYGLLALLVLGPLLVPGFVLTMDMTFTPVLRMPNHVDNTWLFYALLHVLNLVFAADFIQKVMLFAILLLSGSGAHRLLHILRPRGEKFVTPAIYCAAAFYMINPFVYDRFMAGQYGVLLGYSLLPWFAASLYRFVHEQGWKSAIAASLWATAMSIVSIHSIGWIVILVVAALIMYAKKREKLYMILKFGVVAAVIFAILGAYWLIPTLFGHGRIADSLSTFSNSERQAFATVDTNGTSQLGAVLGLQGFWEDTKQLYILPIDATPQWGWVELLVWAILATGMVVAWHTHRRRAMYAFTVMSCAILLALGVGGDWIAAHVPFFVGFREPQKFVALLAFVYAYFMMFGVTWLLNRAARWREWAVYPAMAAMLLGILAFTSPMLWGFYGQLSAVRYPDDWFAMNRLLNQQPGNDRVLFLPWHLYMGFNFSGRIIANPAGDFFDRSVVMSDDPELSGVAPQTRNDTREQVQHVLLPAGAKGEAISSRLRAQGIGYILLAKELDWQDYAWLDRQPGIKLVRDSANLRLYRLTNDTIGLHEND